MIFFSGSILRISAILRSMGTVNQNILKLDLEVRLISIKIELRKIDGKFEKIKRKEYVKAPLPFSVENGYCE